jgi:hypothetical protein
MKARQYGCMHAYVLAIKKKIIKKLNKHDFVCYDKQEKTSKRKLSINNNCNMEMEIKSRNVQYKHVRVNSIKIFIALLK